ncbi:MAG: hypothetical protein ACTJH1_07165 [Corynebacterium variabile]|nr:hypothetical protein [Corynebacterium variabile]
MAVTTHRDPSHIPKGYPVIEFLNLLLTVVQLGTQIITGGLVSLSVG